MKRNRPLKKSRSKFKNLENWIKMKTQHTKTCRIQLKQSREKFITTSSCIRTSQSFKVINNAPYDFGEKSSEI